MAPVTDETRHLDDGSASLPRQAVESVICLIVAVLIFRTFAAEGYMISTGSMAPHLLGFHKQVTCPACGMPFAVGVSFDQSAVIDLEGESGAERVVCPNCTQSSIDISRVPRNHGDQLLVHKYAHQFRLPQRWETAVFRNPAKPREAYVKRIVGLPGEAIRIIRGDVYVDGELARKSYDVQQSLRIAVHDHSRQPPAEGEWRPRWTIQPPEDGTASRWQPFSNVFVHPLPDVLAAEEPLHWVTYRHWIRQGGVHETSVPLAQWPSRLDLSDHSYIRLRFDAREQTLSCTGAMPPDWVRQLQVLTDDAEFLQAVDRLYEQSHIAPITDDYSYNALSSGRGPSIVRDVMLELTMHWEGGAGEFVAALRDDLGESRCRFDFARDIVELYVPGEDEPVRTAPIPLVVREEPVVFEMSNFDRQAVATVNGEPLFPAYAFPAELLAQAAKKSKEVPREKVAAFAARRIEVAVAGLKLYRDIHYTSGASKHGIFQPHHIAEDEYFVLGDNSPVSHDSRRWGAAGVPHRFLLGKPFLVHLPSKPGKIRIGQREAYIRVPDFSRVRYIR